MKVKNKIKISILDFVLYGKFDYVKIGNTKEWILNNFPDPDDFGCGSNLNNAKIWRYGNIEFHFEDEKLTCIFSDYVANLDGGKSLIIESIFFNDKSNLEQIVKKFISLKVEFTISYNDLTKQTTMSFKDSNVHLTFTSDMGSDDPNDFLISSIYLK